VRYSPGRHAGARAQCRWCGRDQERDRLAPRRAGGGWQVAISHKIEIPKAEALSAAKAVDVGVSVPYATSDGELFHLPRTMARLDSATRRAQKKLSRGKRRSKRYAKKRARVAKLKARAARVRRHLSHEVSRHLARTCGMVAIEDLSVRSMNASARGTADEPGRNVAQKSGLNRAILNVGWHAFAVMLAYKLEETGGQLVKVRAAYTSQTCAVCGHVDSSSRKSQATFCCTACGHRANADINAARNILARAMSGEDTYQRGNTPLLDVEGKASAPCEASTLPLTERLDAVV